MFSTLAITGLAAHPGGPGPGFGFLWLFVLVPLFVFLVVALIVGIGGRRWRNAPWAGHAHGGPWGHGGHAAGSAAEATLAERFAQGDIEEVEYRARLEVLRANRFPGSEGKS